MMVITSPSCRVSCWPPSPLIVLPLVGLRLGRCGGARGRRRTPSPMLRPTRPSSFGAVPHLAGLHQRAARERALFRSASSAPIAAGIQSTGRGRC
jgi:hypothetical protein